MGTPAPYFCSGYPFSQEFSSPLSPPQTPGLPALSFLDWSPLSRTPEVPGPSRVLVPAEWGRGKGGYREETGSLHPATHLHLPHPSQARQQCPDSAQKGLPAPMRREVRVLRGGRKGKREGEDRQRGVGRVSPILPWVGRSGSYPRVSSSLGEGWARWRRGGWQPRAPSRALGRRQAENREKALSL